MTEPVIESWISDISNYRRKLLSVLGATDHEFACSTRPAATGSRPSAAASTICRGLAIRIHAAEYQRSGRERAMRDWRKRTCISTRNTSSYIFYPPSSFTDLRKPVGRLVSHSLDRANSRAFNESYIDKPAGLAKCYAYRWQAFRTALTISTEMPESCKVCF
jgi:hypothetical protein